MFDFIIDPGYANLCVADCNNKKIYLFHCNSYHDIIKTNFPNIIKNASNIAIEKQIKSNIIVQGFIEGIIKAVNRQAKIFRINPKIKNRISKLFSWKYKKIRSKKAYLGIPNNLRNEFQVWQIFNNDEETNILNIKKRDDIIDVIIFYLGFSLI